MKTFLFYVTLAASLTAAPAGEQSVLPASTTWQFQRPTSLPEITYRHAGEHYELKDYLVHLPITGLLIAQEDHILFEGYQQGRTEHDLLPSQSMVKTVVAMLAGVALSEHGIASTAASKYVPELRNADYGKVTVLNLLHMSSGVDCQDPEDITVSTLLQNCKQTAPQGTRFRYSANDSAVLGLIVSHVVHQSLANYLQQKIWQNIGTESKATWTVNQAGQDVPYCCFNATLRDYARFARLLAYDGVWNGKPLIPQQWILDATTVKESDTPLSPGKPAPFFGYGYQVWIFPGSRRMFGLLGAHGQRIFVDPQSKLIMVQTATMEKQVDPARDSEMIGLWLSLVHRYGN